MKKKYKKPTIMFEDMKLNAAVAATCEYSITVDGNGILSNAIPGAILFTLDEYNQTCDTSGDVEDIYCFHNPNDLANNILIGRS